MKFPLVSRWSLQRIELELERTRAENIALNARYDHLLAKYHDLVERPTGAAPKPLPKKEPDPVLEAISLAAGNSAPLRRHLAAFAKGKRAEGVEQDEIVQSILHWSPADEEAA